MVMVTDNKKLGSPYITDNLNTSDNCLTKATMTLKEKINIVDSADKSPHCGTVDKERLPKASILSVHRHKLLTEMLERDMKRRKL